jgi:hypothetical protein
MVAARWRGRRHLLSTIRPADHAARWRMAVELAFQLIVAGR